MGACKYQKECKFFQPDNGWHPENCDNFYFSTYEEWCGANDFDIEKTNFPTEQERKKEPLDETPPQT